MCFRTLLTGLTGFTLALWPGPASAGDPTVHEVLNLIDGATTAVKSFDVTVETTTRYFLKYEVETEGNDHRVTGSRKLHDAEAPVVHRKFSRQMFDRGRGRVEYLDSAGGRPSTVIVHDGETEKVLDFRKADGLVRRPNAALLDIGADYLESYRSLHGRLSLIRSLRQRQGVTVTANADASPHVRLEVAPEPGGDVDYPEWGFRLTLDPSRGFIPVVVERYELINGQPFVVARRTVTELKDIGGGVWAPVKMVTQLFDEDTERATFGELASETELKVDLAKSTWNQPTKDATFQFAFPAGVKVNDYFREVSYVTGKSDPGKNLKALAGHARNVFPIVSSLTPVEEPRNRSPLWIVAGVILVVAVGITFVVARRRKLEPQS